MKRLLSSILVLSIMLALVPAGGSVFAASAPSFSANEYYFEDFTGVTTMDELVNDRKLRLSAAQKSQYRLETTPEYGTGLGSFDKGAGSVWIPEPMQNTVGGKINLATFENTPGSSLMISADLFVPAGQKGNLKSVSLIQFLEGASTNSALRFVAKLPQAVVSSGKLYFEGPNGTYDVQNNLGSNMLSDSNSRLEYTNTEDGWINLTSMLTYKDGYYETRYFVNGQPIVSSITGQPSVSKVTKLATGGKDLTLYDKRVNVNFDVRPSSASIDVASGAKPFVLDNVLVSMYKGLNVDKTVSVVQGETSVKVPVHNGYTFANAASVPEYVKKGMIDASTVVPANFAIEKVAKDDKFMLSRTAVTGFDVAVERGGLVFSKLPAMNENDIFRITYKNLKAIDGTAVPEGTIILSTDAAYTDPTDIKFYDIAGERKYPVSADQIPLDVIKIKVDTDKAVALEGSNGKNYTGVGGVLDFSAMVLESGATYTLKIDGSDYASFTTSANGSIACSPLAYENGAIKGNIHNSTRDTASYTLAIMGIDASGNIVSTVTKPLSIGELSITPINEIVSGADSYKAVIWGNTTTFEPMVPQMVVKTTDISETTKTKASIFDNDRNMTIEGKLAEPSRLSVVLYDEAETTVKYADDVVTTDAAYKYTLKIPADFATGTYKLTITDGKSVVVDSMPVHYAKSSENQTAIGLVNDAADGPALSTVISDNQAKLEFYFDGYYDKMDSLAQGNVADILYEDIKDTDLTTTDKPAAVKAFRRAVLAKAAEKGLVSDFDELEEYYPELLTDPFRKWMNTSGKAAIVRATPLTQPVSTERRKTWQSGALARLTGVPATTTADFVSKLREAALLECIEDPDGYENIRAMITEYETANYLTVSTAKLTNNVCSKLVGKDFADYAALVAEIDRLYELPTTPPTGGGGSGSGGGGGGIVVTVPVDSKGDETAEPITPVTPVTPVEPVKGLNDISGSWAKAEIQKLYDAGIVSGNGNGKYEPERSIAREEFVAIACRVLELKPILDASLPFGDVAKNDWEYEYVRAAYQNGIINGVSDVSFGKGASISRQDIAVILENILSYKKLETEAEELNFKDNSSIADYAKSSVAKMVKIGVINGYEDNSFGPERPATRAEMAAMMNRFLEFVKNVENSDTDIQE